MWTVACRYLFVSLAIAFGPALVASVYDLQFISNPVSFGDCVV